MVSCLEGFEYLSLSDPNQQKRNHRVGWVKFTDSDHALSAYEKLQDAKIDDFSFHIGIHTEQKSFLRITPDIASTQARISKDLERSDKLIKVFDQNSGLDGLYTINEVWQRIVNEKMAIELAEDAEEGVIMLWKVCLFIYFFNAINCRLKDSWIFGWFTCVVCISFAITAVLPGKARRILNANAQNSTDDVLFL